MTEETKPEPTTAQRIEKFIGKLPAETRLYPDLYAERLAIVLAGGKDPGAMRRDGTGALILLKTGEPFEKPEPETKKVVVRIDTAKHVYDAIVAVNVPAEQYDLVQQTADITAEAVVQIVKQEFSE